MSTTISVIAEQANGERDSLTIDKLPTECPICHRGQRPVDLSISFLGSETKSGVRLLQRVHRCVYEDCEVTFISNYGYVKNNPARFMSSVPKKFIAKVWEDSINALSPDFVEIYSQASEAESRELDKIAGPGYRKALEFLIKDWLIANGVTDENTIKDKQLSACINEYIDEQVIKDVASRATWLGNDETHYLRKWTDKDLNDLKRLIELTASWVNMRELSTTAVTDMPKPEKS